MTIAEKLKHLRTTIGITQGELAQLLDVGASSVEKWEHGQVESIPISKIKAMAKIFDVDPSYLVADDVDE